MMVLFQFSSKYHKQHSRFVWDDKILFNENKPSKCSDSCNECHATTKLQTKNSMKHLLNTLEIFLKQN